jgi:hypothetical protein
MCEARDTSLRDLRYSGAPPACVCQRLFLDAGCISTTSADGAREWRSEAALDGPVDLPRSLNPTVAMEGHRHRRGQRLGRVPRHDQTRLRACTTAPVCCWAPRVRSSVTVWGAQAGCRPRPRSNGWRILLDSDRDRMCRAVHVTCRDGGKTAALERPCRSRDPELFEDAIASTASRSTGRSVGHGTIRRDELDLTVRGDEQHPEVQAPTRLGCKRRQPGQIACNGVARSRRRRASSPVTSFLPKYRSAPRARARIG